MPIVNVYSNTIEYSVTFTLDDVLALSLKRKDIDERSEFPVYALTSHLDGSILPNGDYTLTDVAMSTFVHILVSMFKKQLIFRGNKEESITINYFNTSGQETPVPFFISDQTDDEQVNILIQKQLEFRALWEHFTEPERNKIWGDTINYLLESDYLNDFFCLVNIEREISINLGA